MKSIINKASWCNCAGSIPALANQKNKESEVII